MSVNVRFLLLMVQSVFDCDDKYILFKMLTVYGSENEIKVSEKQLAENCGVSLYALRKTLRKLLVHEILTRKKYSNRNELPDFKYSFTDELFKIIEGINQLENATDLKIELVDGLFSAGIKKSTDRKFIVLKSIFILRSNRYFEIEINSSELCKLTGMAKVTLTKSIKALLSSSFFTTYFPGTSDPILNKKFPSFYIINTAVNLDSDEADYSTDSEQLIKSEGKLYKHPVLSILGYESCFAKHVCGDVFEETAFDSLKDKLPRLNKKHLPRYLYISAREFEFLLNNKMGMLLSAIQQDSESLKAIELIFFENMKKDFFHKTLNSPVAILYLRLLSTELMIFIKKLIMTDLLRLQRSEHKEKLSDVIIEEVNKKLITGKRLSVTTCIVENDYQVQVTTISKEGSQ